MMLKLEDLPPADALIDYGEHGCGAVMFHFAPKGFSIRQIAHEHGFVVCLLEMAGDESAAALFERHQNGDVVLPEWNPLAPEGWTLGGKFCSDEGPFAIFLRPHHEGDLKPTVSFVGRA